jgi:hypothetical protein
VSTAVLIALSGGCLILLSAVLGWAEHPFGQGIPFRPSFLAAAPAFGIRISARYPNLGQVIVFLGAVAAAPPVLHLRGPAWDIVRRAAGGLMAVLVIRFPILYGDLRPEDGGTLGALRLGFYVAAAGALAVLIAPRARDDPPVRLGWGPLGAFLGAALLAFSTQMTWTDRGFLPPGTDDPGIIGGDFPLPRLIVQSAEGLVPTVGHVLVALAIGAMILATVGHDRRSFDALRRGLGVVVLLVLGLFAFRVNQVADISGSFEYSMIGLLRLGYLVAVAGALLMVVAGHRLRASDSTGATGSAPPPVPA